ncbi:MAG: hypothetical protein ACQEQ4_10000 [Fibrobacterota bacterium]
MAGKNNGISFSIRMCVFAVLAGMLCVITAVSAEEFAGGSGTEEDPYRVETVEHLTNVRNHPGSYFTQTGDIVFEESAFSPGGRFHNGGLGWEPVAGGKHPFSGTYDGSKKTITGLYINRPQQDMVGLFGCVTGTIRNVIIEEANITGNEFVGGIAGKLTNGDISNCHTGGTVSGETGVGGVVGLSNTSIHNCFSRAEVTANSDFGSFVGQWLFE